MKRLNGGKLTNLDTRNDAQKAVDEFLDVLPSMLELIPHQTKALKVKYDALIKEGFSKQDALEIIKTRPIFE